MATSNDYQSEGRGTKWEGYSNYQEVSSRMSRSVDAAIESYALLQSVHKEGAEAASNADLIAEARADILGAAIPLFVEMQEEQARGVDDYDGILERWEGDRDREGYVRRMHSAELRDGVPGWMFQFVLDIRKAGWSLGYLQAGRRSKQEPDDPVQAEVENMFEGL